MAKVKVSANKQSGVKGWIKLILAIVVGLLAGAGIDLAVRPTKDGDLVVEASYQMELSEDQSEKAIIEDNGEMIEVDAVTVEAIDGDQLAEDECKEGEECGRGWYVDTSSPEAFRDAIYGQCIDTDGHYGSQCWDSMNLFFENYAGRTLSTCGTGAAKGTLNCWEYNAGNEFEMIWSADDIQIGDIVVFTNGQYGHIGMAMGPAMNGYVALLGTNQGGSACPGGGSSANIINISLKNFGGAFRPKEYIKVEPIIPITGCLEWAVKHGDTMGKIMYECEGFLSYGEVMNAYAKSWYSRIVKPGQSVYDGWHSKSGVGLYSGDIIDHLVGE